MAKRRGHRKAHRKAHRKSSGRAHTKQANRMRHCAAQIRSVATTSADRKRFMSPCLSGDASKAAKVLKSIKAR